MAGGHDVSHPLDHLPSYLQREHLLDVQPGEALIPVQGVFVRGADGPDTNGDAGSVARLNVGNARAAVPPEHQLVTVDGGAANSERIRAAVEHLVNVQVAPIGDVVFPFHRFLRSPRMAGRSAGLLLSYLGLCLGLGAKGSGQVVAAGLELRTAQAQALHQDVGHQRGLLLCSVARTALEVEPGVLAVNGPGAHGQAELDVGLNLASVGGAVEQPELDRPLGEESVEINTVVAAGVVVLVVDTAGVAIVGGAVPDALDTALGLFAVTLHGFQQSGVHLLAPAVGAVTNFQSLIEQILAANGEVHQAGQAGGGMVLAVHMDVDAAGTVGDSPGLAESADDVLQVIHILVLEDGGHNLAGKRGTSGNPTVAGRLALGEDAAIRHGFQVRPFRSVAP